MDSSASIRRMTESSSACTLRVRETPLAVVGGRDALCQGAELAELHQPVVDMLVKPVGLPEIFLCVHRFHTSSCAFTAFISAVCVVSLRSRASMICSSMVFSAMMWWITTVSARCPCRHRRALVCWYSSNDHVRPNQISVFPPACKFRPCPADAG